MDIEKRKCWNCYRYKAFYTKGYFHFDKKDVGYCQHHKKIVNKTEYCEQWSYGIITTRNKKRTISLELTEIKNKLAVIEQALKEDININDL